MPKKTIIFCAPQIDDWLAHHIEQQIREYGYNVVSLTFPICNWKYKSLKDRAVNFFRKTILQDKAYKRLLRFRMYEKELTERLNAVARADYALVIGTDIYPEYFIKNIKHKVGKMYAYQWDGLEAYPIAKQHIKHYDKFYVFDHNDLKYQNKHPHILGISNFFFEREIENIKRDNGGSCTGKTVYYLGSYAPQRYPDLLKINEALQRLSFEVQKNINLYVSAPLVDKADIHKDFNKLLTPFSYKRNLVETYHSDIIIDLLSNHHDGLSFRPFEAIGFGKKLITTNKSIKNYDFYRPENIFIWGDDRDLETFILGEYQSLPKEIYEKYSFRNWLKNILEEDGKIPISLPK